MADEKHVDPIQGEIVHVYDGIQEADNRLPMWWLWTFYLAVLFSIGYWFYYEEFEAAPGLAGQYYAEKAAAAAKSGKEPTSAELAGLVATPAVEKGRESFVTLCSACHEADGRGKIGPNLTDDRWLHGGSPVAIFRSIRDGVPAKGMPAWVGTLGPAGVQNVAAYVLSIRDTNLPGKAPEGEPYDPASEGAASSETEAAVEGAAKAPERATDVAALPEGEAKAAQSAAVATASQD